MSSGCFSEALNNSEFEKSYEEMIMGQTFYFGEVHFALAAVVDRVKIGAGQTALPASPASEQ